MITFEKVSKRYPDGTVAVDELDLECASGEVTVLVGTSGSGKTTTMRMINRMVDPTAGRILLDGENIARQDPVKLRRRMGYVIQQAGLFPHRTIVDNIATVPVLLGARRREARILALELMERVGLDAKMAKRYPYQLSGGQQQRVGVARALASDPPILLMDEPFSAVDPVVRHDLQDELLRLQADLAKTIVFVTHDMDEAIRVGDRVAVFRTGGQLVQFATPDRLLAAPADEFVSNFLGTDRGIRRLSFASTSGLALDATATVLLGASADEARTASSGAPWLLVLDDAERPYGWLRIARLAGENQVEKDLVESLGHPFTVGTDSLRAALDASVLSPTGKAVAVDTDGRLVGIASGASIATAIAADLQRVQDAAESETA
jgi:osmoprotectant transport system ATP-binding protein